MEYYDSFPRLSLLAHTIEILISLLKAETCDFGSPHWRMRIGYDACSDPVAQSGSVYLWSGWQLLPQVQSPISFLLLFFFFWLELTGNAALCSKLHGHCLERRPTVERERKRRRPTSMSSNNGKSHRQTASQKRTTTKQLNNIPIGPFPAKSPWGSMILTQNFEFWCWLWSP